MGARWGEVARGEERGREGGLGAWSGVGAVSIGKFRGEVVRGVTNDGH